MVLGSAYADKGMFLQAIDELKKSTMNYDMRANTVRKIPRRYIKLFSKSQNIT